MKSGRKKMMIAILAILLAALILNAICTGGISFNHNGGFERSRTAIFKDVLTGKYFSEIRLGEYPNNPFFYIPMVFYIYGVESPPYVILLDIDDETESIEKIFIELIYIEYVDGQKISHDINWERKFKFTSILKSIDSKPVRVPVGQLIDKLPVTVDRKQSCNIRFVGYFVNKEGVNIPFDTTKSFEYEAHKWRISSVRGYF